MFEKWDFVRIVDADDEFRNFIGQEGIIVEVDPRWPLPYSVVFFNRNYQKVSVDNGGLLWKDSHLEGI